MNNKVFKHLSFIVILCGMTMYIFTAVYVGNRVYFDNKKKADAIIVLGAKSFEDGQVNQCVKARVEHAVNLYNDGFADKIIMSGGTDKKPVFSETNEGEEMKKMALGIDESLNPSDILIEGESTSTYENLLYSNEIMKENNIDSIIIVTEPFHSPRANLVAEKLGLSHSVSPTMTSECWNNWKYISTYFLREPAVLIAYKLLNQI